MEIPQAAEFTQGQAESFQAAAPFDGDGSAGALLFNTLLGEILHFDYSKFFVFDGTFLEFLSGEVKQKVDKVVTVFYIPPRNPKRKFMNHLVLISYFNALSACPRARVQVILCRDFWQVWATRDAGRNNTVSAYHGFRYDTPKGAIARAAADLGPRLDYHESIKAYDHRK